MKKRTTSTALLIAMLASLTACGETPPPNDSSVTDTSASTETTLPASETLDLPDKDWEGREFNVLAYDATRDQFDNFEIYAEAENGEVVNDAVFRRNSLIEDKYNVVIKQTNVENGDWNLSTMQELRQSTLAGDTEYDLAFVTLSGVGTVAREGLMYNLHDADYIDFTKEWWNQDVNDTLEVNGKLFFTSSDFSLRDKNRAYIMVYNRDMVNEFKLGNPVELVRSGKWTIDVVTQWAKTVANDLNGNGELDDTDRFGFGTDSYNGLRSLLYGFDVQTLKRDSSGNLEIALNTERTVNGLDKLMELTTDESVFVYPEKWNGKIDYDYWSISGKNFKEGRQLFISSFPHSLKNLSAECKDEYGIIAFPKYDEEQENYYTLADNYAMLFGIPVQAKDPDFSGFMLEALSHYSTDTVLPAYYEITCKTKYTYDPDSAEMLDLIFSGIRYDLATIYAIEGLSGLLYNLAQKDSNTFASDFASIEATAKASLEKLSEDFG